VCYIALQIAATMATMTMTTTTTTMADRPLQCQPSMPPATPITPDRRPMMEGDTQYHWAAIGEINCVATAIIAME